MVFKKQIFNRYKDMATFKMNSKILLTIIVIKNRKSQDKERVLKQLKTLKKEYKYKICKKYQYKMQLN